VKHERKPFRDSKFEIPKACDRMAEASFEQARQTFEKF